MSTATWITVQEAATSLKRTDRQIQEYCRSGWLSCKKKKGKLLIAEDSLEVFKLLYEGSREGAFKEESEEAEVQKKAAGMTLADELDNEVTDEQAMISNSPVQLSETEQTKPETEQTKPETVQAKSETVQAKPETKESKPKPDKSKSTATAADLIPALDTKSKKQMGEKQKMSDMVHNGNGNGNGSESGSENYINMLNTLRERITEHMEAERAFGTDMLNLIDSVQSVMQNVQNKEDKLIQDIVQVVSKYSVEEENK